MEKACEHCGALFNLKPSHIARRHYCSVLCKNAARRQRVPRICEHCGTAFEVALSRIKHGRGKHCSPACQYAALKTRESNVRIERDCLHCGVSFSVYRSTVEKRGGGKYCRRECRDMHRAGVNHPQYLNGVSQEKRGPNWQAQRRKAKHRDDCTCQNCGLSDTGSVEKFGQPLQVHHVIPFRFFDGYEKANRLRNLTTLCAPCHRRADAAIARTEREAGRS